MKKLGKNINGQLKFCSNAEKKGIVVANPSEDILKLVFGYKDIIIPDETPIINEDTEYLELKVISETEEEINCEYVIKQIEEVVEE